MMAVYYLRSLPDSAHTLKLGHWVSFDTAATHVDMFRSARAHFILGAEFQADPRPARPVKSASTMSKTVVLGQSSPHAAWK